MQIQDLNRMFQAGEYQDYPLAEYQFMRRWFQLTKPERVACVGGHTNLDLFYASQGHQITATNHDPDEHYLGLPRQDLKAKHDEFQKLFDYQGSYQWIQQTISDLKQVGEQDLIWLSAHQAGVYDLEQWPDTLVFNHYGDMTRAEQMTHVQKHLPLVALGRRLAVFSEHTTDPRHDSYMLTPARFMGQHTWEIQS